MSDVRRDLSELNAPVDARVFEGRVARVHPPEDPLIYADGPEFRRADEVQNIASQLPGKPITLGHPDGLMSDGAQARVVGTISSSKIDGDFAVAQMVITDQEALDAIQAGLHELSLGYRCTLDANRYQVGIKIDHLALVPRGRCKTCALRADKEDAMVCPVCGSMMKPGEMMCGWCEAPMSPTDPQCAMCASDVPGTEVSGTGCDCPPINAPAPVADEDMPTEDDEMMSEDKKLNAKERHALPGGDFAIPSREGLPIQDEGHLRAAMARFGQTDFKSSSEKRSAYHKILAKARTLGVDASGFKKEWSGRLDCMCGATDLPLAEVVPNLANMSEPAISEDDVTALKAATDRADAEKIRADAAELLVAELTAAKVAAEIEATNAKKDADSARADAEAQKSKVAAAEEAAKTAAEVARKDADDLLATRVAEAVSASKVRGALEAAAATVLGAADRAALSDRDIKIAVIKHVDGDDIESTRVDQYVDGVYEGALRRHAKGATALSEVRQVIDANRADVQVQLDQQNINSEAAASAAQRDRLSSAWMRK